MEDENGQKSFWGLHNCYTESSGNFSESVEALSSLDISTVCRSLLRRGMIRMSGFTVQKEELNDPVIYDFNVYGYKWRLEIFPRVGFTITDICYICSSEVEYCPAFGRAYER